MSHSPFISVVQEKKKTRKALESRKVMQGKLDIYEKRYDVSGVTRGIKLNFMGKIIDTI